MSKLFKSGFDVFVYEVLKLPTRLTSSFRAFDALLLLAILFTTAGIPAVAQESAADRTGYLRDHLSEVQNAYGEAIDKPATEAASVRRDRLRLDLRVKLGDLFTKATSSEATLAVYRADAEATLEAIRAYEKALGVGRGEGTTFWNVLSAEDLGRMREVALKRVNALKVERLNLPEGHTPTSLEFRIREIEGWLGSLDAEAARRTGNGQIRLKPIRGDLSAEEARAKFPEIGSTDGPVGREQVFKRQLALQVNLRQHNAPGDAALATLRDALPNITSPPPSSAPTRGPPASVEMARDQLRIAHLDELKAVTRRDAVAIAQARAKATTTREWLRHTGTARPADRLGLSETPTEHLHELRDGWRKWRARLVIEQQSLPASASVDIQLKEVESRIREIDAIIERRLLPRPPDGRDFGPGLPPDGPAPDGPAPVRPASDGPAPSKGPSGRAFERGWERQVAHNELTELAKIVNEPGSPKVEAGEAAAKAFRARVSAEAQSIRTAYDETIELQRRLLISGRGTETLESGKQLRQARSLIQSAAHELRTSLAGTALSGDPAAASATAALVDIPRPSAPTGTDSFGRGLTALENAREAVEAAARPADIQIHSVAGGEASPGASHRIRLAGKPPAVDSNPVIKRPADYTNLYPKNSRPQTLPDLIKDPKRAPGGVIVDAKLPAELAGRLKGLEVDVNSGDVKVSLDGSWRTLRASPDALLARTAWAFVLDGRNTVIDLRPLQDTEAMWLFLQYGESRLPPTESREVLRQLAGLTSVNVNDALRDTPLVPRLVVADQLMFDLLPRSAFAVEGEDTRYGLPLRELRAAYRADAADALNNKNWQDVLFNKSILAVSQVDYEDGADLVITPRFSFHLFGVPSRGDGILRLPASERWFADHERELRRLRQLSRLADFAALVTLFRAAHERNVPHNLDDLVTVNVPASDAPRFILRRDRISADGWQRLQNSLSGKERQP
jgi:hypothetical protein